MDPEFLARVQAAAAASVEVKPRVPLPPLKLAWRVEQGVLAVLWPDGSPWVLYRPESPCSIALVARVASEAFRRMHVALGPEVAAPFLAWLTKGQGEGGSSEKTSLPLFFLADVVRFDPSLDLTLDLRILPPAQ